MFKAYDSTLQAYTEHPPKCHDTALNAWVDSPSAKTFDTAQNAWVERLKHWVQRISSQGVSRMDIEETSISTTFPQTSSYTTQQVEFELPSVRNGDGISFDYSCDLQAVVVVITKKGGYTLFGPSSVSGIPTSGTASFQVQRTNASDLDEGVCVRMFRISQGQSSFPEVDATISNLSVNGTRYYFK